MRGEKKWKVFLKKASFYRLFYRMRFAIKFKVLNQNFLPITYRKCFISLLKAAFQKASPEIFETFYSANRIKPFTFSVYIPGGKVGEDKILLSKTNETILNFSTCCSRVGAELCNGILRMPEGVYQYKSKLEGEIVLRLENIEVKKEPVIKSRKVRFKTLSPLIVREHIQSTEGQQDIYYPLDANNLEKFNRQLNINMKPVFEEYFGENHPVKVTLKNGDKIRHVPIKVRRKNGEIGFLKGNIGTFTLQGSPEALNFIYQVGLGAKRSYGFGMLELVEEL